LVVVLVLPSFYRKDKVLHQQWKFDGVKNKSLNGHWSRDNVHVVFDMMDVISW